jgi:hypothetical protein
MSLQHDEIGLDESTLPPTFVTAAPYTATLCQDCVTWILSTEFGEDGDRTKPISGRDHWLANHDDGAPRIGIPYQKHNAETVQAIIHTN